MKFSDLPLSEAEGAMLAHSLPVSGGVLKKGRMLSRADVAAIAATGKTTVMAARLEAGDIAEEMAAAEVATLLTGPGIRAAAPFTGRVNLFSMHQGLVTIDRSALDIINGIDEAITVATLPPFERVSAGDMVATIKIIPFSVPQAMLQTLRSGAPQTSAMSVAAFSPHRAGLILTRLPGMREQVLEKRVAAMTQRVTALGSTIERVDRVGHDIGELSGAIGRHVTAGLDPILIFGASAIVDQQDVVPRGLVVAGGFVVRLGMPVDPGNLLMIGHHGASRVIGVPSCAASLKRNGFDWVLERCLAGIGVGKDEVAAMGIGGLLKEIASRPQPRAGGESNSGTRRAPRVAAIVLAAGRSSRMSAGGTSRNKLLEHLGGKPIVRHACEAALASSAGTVIVVLGHDGERVRHALAGLPVTFADNPDHATGMASSLRAGLAALPADIDAAVVALGDMPEVTAEHFDKLIAAFAPDEGRTIVVPVFARKRGNPVLWGSGHFAEMAAVTGDKGARDLLAAHADAVVEIELMSDAVLADVDTPAALEEMRLRHGS